MTCKIFVVLCCIEGTSANKTAIVTFYSQTLHIITQLASTSNIIKILLLKCRQCLLSTIISCSLISQKFGKILQQLVNQ